MAREIFVNLGEKTRLNNQNILQRVGQLVLKGVDKTGEKAEKFFNHEGKGLIKDAERLDKFFDRNNEIPRHRFINAIDKTADFITGSIDKMVDIGAKKAVSNELPEQEVAKQEKKEVWQFKKKATADKPLQATSRVMQEGKAKVNVLAAIGNHLKKNADTYILSASTAAAVGSLPVMLIGNNVMLGAVLAGTSLAGSLFLHHTFRRSN